MIDFEILKELGTGSFGRVLKVRKIQNSEIYAMKTVKMMSLSHKEKQLTLNQIRLLASIDSPYVIQYKGAFFQENNNMLSILMEYADGGDLEGLIKKKYKKKEMFDEKTIMKITYQILKGLKFLHSNHIVHRDVKTANVFFSQGTAKLGDLNLSKVMKSDFAVTNAGTPYYTSPEIWLGNRYTQNCDIWSLGCMIYEMCCFRHPFEGRNMPELMKRVVSGFYNPIPSVYSKRLAMLIRRCLIVDNKKRPSADQLLTSINFGNVNDLGEGQANLLDTIRCPRMLNQLNQNLPSFTPNKERPKLRSHHDSPLLYKNSNVSLQKNRAISINSENSHKYIKIKKIISHPDQQYRNQPVHQHPLYRGFRL